MTERNGAVEPGSAGFNRMERVIEFSGFRDLAPPDRLAAAIVEIYGAGAAAAARECADSAFADRRGDDYCFWLAVLALIERAGGSRECPERAPER